MNENVVFFVLFFFSFCCDGSFYSCIVVMTLVFMMRSPDELFKVTFHFGVTLSVLCKRPGSHSNIFLDPLGSRLGSRVWTS